MKNTLTVLNSKKGTYRYSGNWFGSTE